LRCTFCRAPIARKETLQLSSAVNALLSGSRSMTETADRQAEREWLREYLGVEPPEPPRLLQAAARSINALAMADAQAWLPGRVCEGWNQNSGRPCGDPAKYALMRPDGSMVAVCARAGHLGAPR
jgi:hypothetical protein